MVDMFRGLLYEEEPLVTQEQLKQNGKLVEQWFSDRARAEVRRRDESELRRLGGRAVNPGAYLLTHEEVEVLPEEPQAS